MHNRTAVCPAFCRANARVRTLDSPCQSPSRMRVKFRGFAVLATGGDVAAAHECFEVSLRAAQTWNNPYERAITLDALSRTAQLLRHPEAARLREEARVLIERQGGVSVGVLSLPDVVELPTSETALSDA